MCATCGCGKPLPGVHRLELNVLAQNGYRATANRQWLDAHAIAALNLVSSPGAGKTTLLEVTIRALGDALRIRVIEGDQASARDAERIQAAGAPALQINTGAGCHLDAEMIARALPQLRPEEGSLLFIENVGNLVCPALFDLGERAKVLLHSVTEGDDKALKYPHMFKAARLVLLTKIDLLPYVPFDAEASRRNVLAVNPEAEILSLSATSGEGLEAWFDWLRREARRA